MNKKVLSTVMAGAMLATTVAPVMAYTVHDYGAKEYKVHENEKEEIAKKIVNVMEATQFETGGSVYQLEIDGREVNLDLSDPDKIEERKNAIIENIKNANVGDVIKIIDRGHIKEGNKYYHYYKNDTVVYKKYEIKKDNSDTLKDDFDAWNTDTNKTTNYPEVNTMEYKDRVLKVTLKNGLIREYKIGENRVDFKKPIDSNKNETTDSSKVDNFKELTEEKTPKYFDANATNVNKLMQYVNWHTDEYETVQLLMWDKTIAGAEGEYFEVRLKNGYTFSNSSIEDEGSMYIQSQDNRSRKYLQNSRKIPDLTKPIFESANSKVIKGFSNYKEQESYIGQSGSQIDGKIISKITIVKDETPIKPEEKPDSGLEDLIPPKPPVNPPVVVPPTKPEEKPENKPTMEVLAGDDRYETAVEVANKTANTKDVAGNGNLVLVNGNALVDGLAASPLASILGKTSNVEVAPILLTKTDSLPESTKDYIKEVVSKKSTGKVKVYIVGGNAVVSEKVEKELKELGVDVVRSGGSNREETSLKVAELISKNKKPYNTFVVGANGEADAMSIAPVAADREEPIIVSKNGGLSKAGVQKIVDLKANATIVGGTEVVSEATEKALKDAKISTSRVAGSNRQKTNAAIIDRYAKNGLNKIIVSKDGSAKKDELVDALTSTSLAVKEDAPIVLATDKISDEQINALKNKADKGVFIYQIGYGVSNNVLETLAAKIGLLK